MMKIRKATVKDAPFLAQVIMMAVGTEITESFAGDNHTLKDVAKLFTTLAEREDSQYSYRNSLIATTEDGQPIGGIIGYDGASLHRLRKAFFEESSRLLNYHLEGKIPDETSSDEFYLDSLAVVPAYRGKGVASALITAMIQRAAETGKPAALLVDKDNPMARRLYEYIGFKYVDDRPFAGTMMDHLVKDSGVCTMRQ